MGKIVICESIEEMSRLLEVLEKRGGYRWTSGSNLTSYHSRDSSVNAVYIGEDGRMNRSTLKTYDELVAYKEIPRVPASQIISEVQLRPEFERDFKKALRLNKINLSPENLAKLRELGLYDKFIIEN
mgnify:CR=1 FL=1